MPSLPLSRRARRFAVALAIPVVFAASGVDVGCGPDQTVGWLCLNPTTGKEDGSIYDENHYVDGMIDPCHCYDPCGPEASCPIVVDAGPPAPGCDGGTGGGANDGG